MAKKRKNKKPARRKYAMRGIGALVKGGAIIDTLTVAGSSVGSTFLNNVFNQYLPNVNEKIISGSKIALGHFLPSFSKNPKTKKTLQLVGYGLIATGSIELAQQMGVIKISGIGQIQDDDELAVALSMSGNDDIDEDKYDDYTDISGVDDLDVVNDDILNDDILNDDDLLVVNGI